MKNLLTFLIVGLLALVGIAGCGGGGSGPVTPTTIDVEGYVLWVETGSATSPPATVRIGDVSTLTDDFDGFFSLEVSLGATSLTVTYTPASGSPIVRTFTFPAPLNANTDLGELYIGPESVTVRGTAIDSSNGDPIPGALASIGGRFALTGPDGVFTITDVAYSSNTLSVFLGLNGTVEKVGYFQANFNPGSGAVGGVVEIGSVFLTPEGSGVPPPLPFNVSGTVLPSGAGGSAVVEALDGATVLRTTTADGNGSFRFWLPAGTFTLRATKGSQTGTTTVTVVNPHEAVTANITLN